MEMLRKLQKRSLYTCLTIQPKGNKLYILKDRNDSLFVVLIPNRPLVREESEEVINMGFIEVWSNINFQLSVIRPSENDLLVFVQLIEKLFIETLKVGADWPWRIRSDSNFSVIKDLSQPLQTRKQLSERNKRRSKRSQLFHKLSSSLIISLSIIFLLTAFYFLFEPEVNNITIIVILGVFVFPAVRFLKWYLNDQTRFPWIRPIADRRNDQFFAIYGFVRRLDRHQGMIKGYRTEIWRSPNNDAIIVYHKPKNLNGALKLPSTGLFDSYNYNWTREFYGKKTFTRHMSKKKLIKEAVDFVNLMIREKFEPAESVAQHDHEPIKP